MAREKRVRAWRPDADKARSIGLWHAFFFNLSLFLLIGAAATAFIISARENLYTYDLNPASERAVRANVEHQAGQLILLDFDRRRQWDDLVAIELMEGDITAARGLLLSARAMLPQGDVNTLNRVLRGNAGDAEIELAALDLLTPGTRNRYEATVPLLSRRAASGATTRRAPERFELIGDERDFELLAGALLADGDSDSLHLTLTGLGLGLGGEVTPRMVAGASALLAASRQPNADVSFSDEIGALIAQVAPKEAFREEALRRAGDSGDAAAYATSSAAFRAVVDTAAVARATAILDEIGQMSEATSPMGAALLLTHARSMKDLPRLRLVAQAAGDRAAAVAKRAPRDGALPEAARGTLRFTPPLIGAIALAIFAMLGLALSTCATCFKELHRAWVRMRTRDEERDAGGGELVQSFDSPWRVL